MSVRNVSRALIASPSFPAGGSPSTTDGFVERAAWLRRVADDLVPPCIPPRGGRARRPRRRVAPSSVPHAGRNARARRWTFVPLRDVEAVAGETVRGRLTEDGCGGRHRFDDSDRWRDAAH